MKSERKDIARQHLVKHRNTVEMLSDDKFYTVVYEIADLCSDALLNGKKILFMGNGGSAADAQHLAAELVGRYLEDRHSLAAMALNVNTSILTAIANDYSYEEIFARQVEGIGNEGDVLIGLSTSGRSINVIKGLKAGKKKGLKTAALVGNFADDVKDICDIVLTIPEKYTPIIQEMHIMAGHIICGMIEHNIKMKAETAEFETTDV